MCMLCKYTEYEYVDLVYCNCMRVSVPTAVADRRVYDSIESYIRGEQHRSSIVSQVMAEDMKAEKGMYGISMQTE